MSVDPEDLNYLVTTLRQAIHDYNAQHNGPELSGENRRSVRKEDKKLSQSFQIERHDMSDIIERNVEDSLDSDDL